MGRGTWGLRGAEPSPQLGIPEDCPLGPVDPLGEKETERDLEVSKKACFPSLPIYLYRGEGDWGASWKTPHRPSGGGAMRIPKSQEGDPVPGRVSSQRGLLCHTPAPALGLPSVSLAWRDMACPSGFPWKSWESSPFLCGDPPPPPPLRPSPAPTHTHTPRASSPGFPSRADYFMTGCDKW